MDALITKAEAALMLPAVTPSSRRQAEVEALRLAAIAARDEAVANAVRRFFRAAGRTVEALARAVITFPARIETYRALRALSDRELQDIGMTRFDIGRVFDPGFTPRPANDAGERPAPRAA
jgi:uncharacterized protein YjiS (DUF1127 family)